MFLSTPLEANTWPIRDNSIQVSAFDFLRILFFCVVCKWFQNEKEFGFAIQQLVPGQRLQQGVGVLNPLRIQEICSCTLSSSLNSMNLIDANYVSIPIHESYSGRIND